MLQIFLLRSNAADRMQPVGLRPIRQSGSMADRIYDLGGTTMMSETVEFIGAEHVLAKRGETPGIHDQIIRICEEYENISP